MIERSGKVAMSNGEKTIWVAPEDASAWQCHGYALEETQVTMKPVQKPKQQDPTTEESQ